MQQRTLMAALVLLSLAATANGLIPAPFRQADLVAQSDAILVLELKHLTARGEVVVAVSEVLKGEAPAAQFYIDLLASPFEPQAVAVMRAIVGGQKQAVMFIGPSDEGRPGEEMAKERQAYLHMSCERSSAWQWVKLAEYDGVWEMEMHCPHMRGVWCGGTDQLIKAVGCVLADKDAYMPVDEGAEWAPKVRVGKVPGRVASAEPVDLAGDGKVDLFVAGQGGDRLFRFTGEAFEDVTAERGLASRSIVHAWGDFDGDRRLDLASWDGRTLVIHHGQAEGGFHAVPCGEAAEVLKAGCSDLATLDAAGSGRHALVVACGDLPVVMQLGADGRWRTRTLSAPEQAEADRGRPGRCLVADFDGDGFADVLQLYARGSLLWQGRASGEFAAPTRPAVSGDGAGRAACLGDFDGDGLLDLFTSGAEHNHLWQNLGRGAFVDVASISGELAYLAIPNALTAAVGDFNSDGLQDILVAYNSQRPPQLFFNGGFRHFGCAYMLDLGEQQLLPQAADGVQAACLGDFTGDGALDMALVLPDGEAWVFPRKVTDGNNRAALVSLPLGSSCAGPVNVTARAGERILGTWPIRAGDPAGVIGVHEASPIVLSWRLPGGAAVEKTVLVESGPVRVSLGPKDAE